MSLPRWHTGLRRQSEGRRRTLPPSALAIACEHLEAIVQGPISDAMTHAGQLALLRRLAGHPVEPENFIAAQIDPDVVGADQPPPASPGHRDGSGAAPLG